MKKFLLRFNWVSFLSMLALVALGTVAIWSAGNARAEAVFHGMWKANLSTAVLGLAVYFVLALTDYRKVLAVVSVPAYALAVLLLIVVLFAGAERFGGRRWLWFFQPSEVSKLCILSLLAAIFGGLRALLPWLSGFRGFLLAVALAGVPTGLILLEPDLGTALTLAPAVLVMLFAARVWRAGLVTLVAVGATAALAVLGAVGEAERPETSLERREEILRWVPLKPHQVDRVKTFLYPEADPLGAGYNQRQAKISIGSGGFAGKGIGKGESNLLSYLPQAISMNDFIFCVYAEETGYRGTLVLLTLFGLLLASTAWTAARTEEDIGRLLALGVAALLFAHVFINIAMSVGIVPITGLPLPFVSAGRTFLLVVMAGLGLVQSVALHRPAPPEPKEEE